MRVPGIGVPVADYLLSTVANAGPRERGRWKVLRQADLERLRGNALALGESPHLGRKNTPTRMLGAVRAELVARRPDLLVAWDALGASDEAAPE